MLPFADFSFAQWAAFLLVLLRAAALVATLPFLGSNNVPLMVKAGLSLSLAVLISPRLAMEQAQLPSTMAGFAVLAAGELMIGAILGLLVRLLITAVQIMGELASVQMGFSVANVIDPLGGGQVAVVAQLCYLTSLLVFLTVGGHLAFFQALADSYKVLPPGGISMHHGLYQQMMNMTAQMFLLAIKIGAPVTGALLFTQVAMGVVAKTVPQVNILVVGFPITISVGLVFLTLSMGIMVPLLARVFGDLAPLLDSVIKAM